jgi:hypothetical protein
MENLILEEIEVLLWGPKYRLSLSRPQMYGVGKKDSRLVLGPGLRDTYKVPAFVADLIRASDSGAEDGGLASFQAYRDQLKAPDRGSFHNQARFNLF